MISDDREVKRIACTLFKGVMNEFVASGDYKCAGLTENSFEFVDNNLVSIKQEAYNKSVSSSATIFVKLIAETFRVQFNLEFQDADVNKLNSMSSAAQEIFAKKVMQLVEYKITWYFESILTGISCNSLNALASEAYEKTYAQNMYLAVLLGNPNDYELTSFGNADDFRLDLKNIHGIRKLTNMTNDDRYLAVSTYNSEYENNDVNIVCQPVGLIKREHVFKCRLPVIKLVTRACWELCFPTCKGDDSSCATTTSDYELTTALISDGGRFYVPNEQGLIEVELNKLSKFGFNKETSLVRKIINSIQAIGKGTILIFGRPSVISREVRRLCDQGGAGFRLNPHVDVLSDPSVLKSYVSIDGALFLDTDGVCHAVGVIVGGDPYRGLADLRRGSRYNSTVFYINSNHIRYRVKRRAIRQQNRLVAIVVSDDGMLNVLIPGRLRRPQNIRTPIGVRVGGNV